MKETSLDCQHRELMFNKKLTDGIPDIYQNPLAESALQKTFIPCKIKNKTYD